MESMAKKLWARKTSHPSTTRFPAWRDQLKKWNESRAAARKGGCPVGHRGKFQDVLRRLISFEVLGANFHVIQLGY